MDLKAVLPADFPFFGGLPVWLYLVVLLVCMAAVWKINNLWFDWLHRNFPGFFRPRVLLAIVAFCLVIAAIGVLGTR